MSESHKSQYLLRAEDIEEKKVSFSHPWNPKSHIVGVRLGPEVGLKRIGVNVATIPPGKESFVYHFHYRDEEWIYILSGKGIAEIDGREYEVKAGDFMGFSTPQVAHHLRNEGEEDLVYLMGGENNEVEIVDFPKLGKRMFRLGDKVEVYEISDAKGFGPMGKK
jgi:uncharacterized cupin superfamily protein